MPTNKIFQVHRVEPAGLVLMEEITIAYDEALTKINAAIRNAGGHSHFDTWQRAVDKLEESCMLARKSIAIAYRIPERMSDLPDMPPQLDKVAP